MPLADFGESLYRVTGKPLLGEEIAFDVYANYLNNWVSFIESRYKNYDYFIYDALAKTTKIQGNRGLDIEYIRRFLYLGWNTEDLVSVNDKNISSSDIIRVNNQWKPIQVYYSIYSLSEAAAYSLVNVKTESHSKCLNNVSLFLKKINIPPWNMGFTGYLGNRKITTSISPINFTPTIRIPNSLTRVSANAEEIIACCLRAEHRNRIREHERAKNECFKYLYDPGFTTIFHFLYRLRIKSNYKEVEIFLSDAPENLITSFSENLTKINRYTNTLLEILIFKKIGRNKLIQLMGEFIDKFNKKSIIGARMAKYSKLSI